MQIARILQLFFILFSSFANKGSFQDINTISQSLWNMSQAWEILRVTLSSRDFITTLRSSSFERRIFMLMHSGLGRPFTCRSHLRLRWVRHRRSGICLHSNQLGVPVRWDKLVSLRITKSFWKGISELIFIAPSMGHTWSLYGFQFWKENAGSHDFWELQILSRSFQLLSIIDFCWRNLRNLYERSPKVAIPHCSKGMQLVSATVDWEVNVQLLGCLALSGREVQKENLASVPSPYSRIQSLQDWDDIIRCMLTHTGFQDAFHTHDCGHLCLGLHAPQSTSLAGSHNTSCFPRNIVSDLWITRLVDGRGILTRKS